MTTRSAIATMEEMKATIESSIAKHLGPLQASQSSLQATITALSNQIATLEQKIVSKDTHISKLEARVDQLEAANDSLEQYGRRMNIRVENVLHHEDEDSESLQKQVLEMLTAAGAQIQPSDVVRHHRSTPLRRKNESSDTRKYSQVIVKLSNWRARESCHNARNNAREKGFPIKQDLTKWRRELISEANVAIRDWGTLQGPVYTYANINCEPTMRRGRDVRRFSSMGDLQLALGFFKPQ